MVNRDISECLVSICCITYNQEQFIAQTIESFLIQKTTFLFEILIHDDASTDNTANIIRKYALNYPDIIFPIFQTENQYSQGINPAFRFIIPNCRGKYIAVCEGDDYWIDPLKLQKQVDFLEINREYFACAHYIKKYIELDKIFVESKETGYKTYSDTQILMNNIYMPSLLFRNQIKLDEKVISGSPHGDKILLAYISERGKLAVLDFVGAVYRVSSGGVWSGNYSLMRLKNSILTRNAILKFFPNKHNPLKKVNRKLCYSGLKKTIKMGSPSDFGFFLKNFIKNIFK